MTWLPILILVVLLGGLSYFRTALLPSAVSVTALALVYLVSGPVTLAPTILAVLAAASLIFVSITPWRRALISDPALKWFRKVLPSLSKTEQEALEAGTVWWDADLISGMPDWKKLLNAPKPVLRPEEQAFLDGPVEELCGMLNDWEIRQDADLPEHVWDYLKEHGFFSMIISKKYGGLGFSALGNSAVVMKLASRNLTAAVTVMVPNSLGPGELLSHYGTEEQKEYYLPRLARGEEIPCFALTSPSAGSDAAAMPDVGVVCKQRWKGEQTLGFKVSWNKRYITLAPVATVLGLAFRAQDPDGLLGDEADLGITCALVPTNTKGVWIGNRHQPVGAVFMNGPTRGEEVFIPMDYIIGGQERVGQGWRMLMYSLAAGRAISLPALGVAGGKMSALTTGEYARIRKQFNMPIGYFEGIEEPLARMAGLTYRMDAARLLTLVALGMGEKPGVLSAILKYQLTEGNRRCINDAMDVHGGKGVILGPNNYLGATYQALPIAITVEGANILTRTLIVFGQGAIRCHPYLLKEMQAAQAPDSEEARQDFDRALFGHVGFTISNGVRAFFLGLTRSRLVRRPVRGSTGRYYQQLTRMSSAFAFTADIILLALGGAFKFREKISGRLADVLSHLYMCSAVLKHYEDSGRPKEDLVLLRWTMAESLYVMQHRLINTLRNFPIRWLGPVLKFLIFPTGNSYREASDSRGKHAARVLLSDNPARDRLTAGIYKSTGDDATGLLHKAFAAVLDAASIERSLRHALRKSVTLDNYEEVIAEALALDLITEEDAGKIRLAQQLSQAVIDVDDFPREEIEKNYSKSGRKPKAA
ncbi:MAG: acyl-CoA dehydrogenase [Xanthomonadales bacterium]|nr:acyl-CoA dehydrogenase [Xanthomonadales bacterium]